MTNKLTTQPLLNRYLSQGYIPLEEISESDEVIIDISRLRYVIYARKSTDESSGRQVYSIQDQIDACLDYAKKHNLKVKLPPIKESASARIADNRPKFKQMLKDISKGKYDAILAWHPDRLARNMKEAGEILDMLEQGILKDLKFVQMDFRNTTAGKVMLGVHFVFAKMYSDQISDNVKRSYLRRVKEGKIGVFSSIKHGYYPDENGYLRPDKTNDGKGSFQLLRKAFDMRLQGKTYKEIANFLNNAGYSVLERKKNKLIRKRITINHKQVEAIIKNPLYAGILLWHRNDGTKVVINLLEVDPLFEPLITPEEFEKLQQPIRTITYVSDHPFSKKVICAYCGNTMIVYKRKKQIGNKHKYYLYLRCEDKTCYRNNPHMWTDEDKALKPTQNLRVRVPFYFAINHLKELLYPFTKEKQSIVEEFLKKWLPERRKHLIDEKRDIKLKLQRISKEKERINNAIIVISQSEDEKYIKQYVNEYTKKLEALEDKEHALKDRLIALEGLLENLSDKKQISTYLELFKKLPYYLEYTRSIKTIKKIIDLAYLNFTVDLKNVRSYQLKPPFTLLENLKKEADLPGQDSNLRPGG